MATEWRLRSAEKLRLKLTKTQQREITRMYRRVSRSINKQLAGLPDTTSGTLRRIYLEKLQQQINVELTKLGQDVSTLIQANATAVAGAVVDDSISFLSKLGFPIQGAFSKVPSEVVKSILTGQVYDGRWSLSRSIWNSTSKAKKDINAIIAEGIAQNKSTYDIAKDLEKYVNPSAKKDWAWSKVYPGTNKVVDYNAQRLARTMVSHAYQQAFVRITKPNPFVTKYRWLASNSNRVCELCNSRDGVLFEKDDLPMDHPNGMCTFTAVIDQPMTDIADRIADWALGQPDPELDTFAQFLQNS